MKSPFPGMDPYLEDQGRWQDFHAGIITYCRDALSQRLPDDYVAQMGEEVRVVTWQEGRERPMRPDVAIVRGDRLGGTTAAGGSVALLEEVDTLEPVEVPFAAAVDEVRDTWIEIRRLPDERLVTAIEVLSPTNKGSSGLTTTSRKRLRLWNQGVNLVEIDLLIAGRRMPMAGPLPPGRLLRRRLRAGKPEIGDVFAWSIRGPCPRSRSPWRPRPRRLRRPRRALRHGLRARPLRPPDRLRPTARPAPPPRGQGVGREGGAGKPRR